MEEIRNTTKTVRKKSTIPEISTALTDLFRGQKVKSAEMRRSIKEAYDLIDLICNRLPEELKLQLLRWPVNEDKDKIAEFTKKLEERYKDYWATSVAIIKKYKKFFDRGWEWCTKEWKQIVSMYNPSRVNQMMS